MSDNLELDTEKPKQAVRPMFQIIGIVTVLLARRQEIGEPGLPVRCVASYPSAL